jgi:hypothetical protein
MRASIIARVTASHASERRRKPLSASGILLKHSSKVIWPPITTTNFSFTPLAGVSQDNVSSGAGLVEK